MAQQALPVLYVNLGGEMLYILNQRLVAQKIEEEKSTKVIHDIVGTMLNKTFVQELFRPQPIFPAPAIRSIFERVAHASIMRINPQSMDKLYDLMRMVFKYQTLMCSNPKDLLAVTLNHLDGVSEYVTGSPPTRQLVEDFFDTLMQNHADTLTTDGWFWIRRGILSFLQDTHVKVSVLLKTGVQRANGFFPMPSCGPVPFGVQVNGTIRYFEETSGELLKSETFEPGSYFQPHTERVGCRRGTMLGTNIYKSQTVCEENSQPPIRTEASTLHRTPTVLRTTNISHQAETTSPFPPETGRTSGAEMTMLLEMLQPKRSENDEFDARLLALEIDPYEIRDDDEPQNRDNANQEEKLDLQDAVMEWTDCCRAKEIDAEEEEKDDDLLSLMDQAAEKK